MSEHAIDQRPKRGMRSTIHQEGLRLNGDRRFDRNALGLLVGSRFWLGGQLEHLQPIPTGQIRQRQLTKTEIQRSGKFDHYILRVS